MRESSPESPGGLHGAKVGPGHRGSGARDHSSMTDRALCVRGEQRMSAALDYAAVTDLDNGFPLNHIGLSEG